MVGLRLPGHGTVPSGLVTFKWEDMAAAVELAMRHLRGKTNGHELILFDINRRAEIAELLSSHPEADIKSLLAGAELTFAISLVTNKNNESRNVVVRHRPAGSSNITEKPIGLLWPDEIYSLSHVALPFPGNDPVYGGLASGNSPGISLGNLVPRGERNVLQIPAADLLRLRWNPFYAYMEGRLIEFVNK